MLERLSRRTMIKGAAATVSTFMINRNAYALARDRVRSYSKRAVDVVTEALVIDMLAPLKLDLDPAFLDTPFDESARDEFRRSGITGFHHAIGIGGPGAKEKVTEYLAAWSFFVGSQASLFTLVDTAADLDRAKAAGKIAVIVGLQNADQFESPGDVAHFYRMGMRCAQLTYNSQNLLGSGATDRTDGGLSDFGAQIVAAMNAAGMLVDVSHSGARTTLDAIEASVVPMAITHSNCAALNPHVRNKSDEAIVKLAARGGVMGIAGVRMFVKDRDPTNVSDLVDHIDHVVRLAGIEHVGIGSDADLNGYDDMPPEQYKMLKASYKGSYAFREKVDIDGFDHPLKTFDLAEELIARKYSNENIKLVLGGNFRRLLGITWK
jgi:membrane dipeptidase